MTYLCFSRCTSITVRDRCLVVSAMLLFLLSIIFTIPLGYAYYKLLVFFHVSSNIPILIVYSLSFGFVTSFSIVYAIVVIIFAIIYCFKAI